MAAENVEALPTQTDETFEQFLHTMPDFVEGRRDEPVMASFFRAVPEAVATLPDFRKTLRVHIASQADKPIPYLVNKLFKAGQASLIPDELREQEDYPASFKTKERWIDWIGRLVDEPDGEPYLRFTEALISDDNKNRSGRAKAVAFAASTLLDREVLRRGIVLHEPGASGMLVSKALATGDVGRASVITRVVGSKEVFVDEAATLGFNAATRQVRLRKALCIDHDPPTTAESYDRLKAFSLLPSELDRSRPNNSPDGVNHEEMFDMLMMAKPSAPITMIKDDWMNLKPPHRKRLLDNPADIIFLSHMVSQNPDHLDDLLEKALPFVKPRGHIVMNEYAIVSPYDGSIAIHDDWPRPWQVLTAVAEARNPEAGFIPLMQWENSHCETGMIYAEGIGRLVAAHEVRGPR